MERHNFIHREGEMRVDFVDECSSSIEPRVEAATETPT